MLLATFTYVAIIAFPSACSALDNVSRQKRSDDFIPCEKGWYYFRNKCYKAGGSDRLSWTNALARCKSFGGDLVAIQSQEEQEFIITFLQLDVKFFAWIGLNDRTNESDYKWTDGSVFNYTNWNAMEPTGLRDENEDCVHMLFEPENDVIGKWNDKSCDAIDSFICQMKPNYKKKSRNLMYCSAEEGGGWKFEKSCYHVVTELKSWQNAEKHCKDNYNGHLLTISDMIEDLYLEHVLANMRKELWIGIQMQDQLQQKWISGWHVAYDGLSKEEGDFIENTCVARKKRKEWILIPCSKKLSFICEITTATPPVLKLPAKGSHCPEEQDDWRDLDGEYCYYFETTKSVNWYEASFDCKRRGGNLLSVHSPEESNILLPFVKFTQRTVFIGHFRLLANVKQFAWSDGSVVNYKNWRAGEPNNEDEKCVEASTPDMTWNDANCNDRKGYICSVKKISPNSTIEEKIPDCTGLVPLKVLIGVSVCIILVVVLLGIVVYCFRPWAIEQRKKSTASTTAPASPSPNRQRYRNNTELTLKEDEYYEDMT